MELYNSTASSNCSRNLSLPVNREVNFFRLSVPKTSSLCIFRSLQPSVRTLTPLKWRSVLTVKPNVINRLLKTRSIMQERQGAEREVQCLLKIGILARDTTNGQLTISRS